MSNERIEFVDGEDFCRLDGILLDDNYWFELLGVDGEIEYSDSIIIKDNKIYTKNFNIGEILYMLGSYYPPIEKYDTISSKGYGMQSHNDREKLNDSIVVSGFTSIKNMTIVSYDEFFKDYPNFNFEKYKEVIKLITEYYKTM